MTGMHSKSNQYTINFCKPNKIFFDIPTILRHMKELPWISPLHISPRLLRFFLSSQSVILPFSHTVGQ